MIDNIKVSIVVAVYNGMQTLSRCIESILSQTYRNIEIIFVNDCSTDDSISILNDCMANCPNVSLINHTENRHGGGADNSGIRAASGTYICIVDQDDTLNPQSIELLVKNSHGGTDDIVLGQWSKVNSKGEVIKQKNGVIGGSKDDNIKYTSFHGMRILGGLFKKKLYYDNNLFYPEKVNFADNAIYGAILIASNSITVIEDSVYNYYILEQSSSKMVSLKDVEDRVYTTDLCLTNCLRVDKNDQYTSLIKYRYLYLSTYTIYLLGLYPYKVVKIMLHKLNNDIKGLLPNPYFNTLSEDMRGVLLDPIGYVKRQERLRNINKIKVFFHSIRHNIAVFIKKIIKVK